MKRRDFLQLVISASGVVAFLRRLVSARPLHPVMSPVDWETIEMVEGPGGEMEWTVTRAPDDMKIHYLS
jgi:hypothetical protein